MGALALQAPGGAGGGRPEQRAAWLLEGNAPRSPRRPRPPPRGPPAHLGPAGAHRREPEGAGAVLPGGGGLGAGCPRASFWLEGSRCRAGREGRGRPARGGSAAARCLPDPPSAEERREPVRRSGLGPARPRAGATGSAPGSARGRGGAGRAPKRPAPAPGARESGSAAAWALGPARQPGPPHPGNRQIGRGPRPAPRKAGSRQPVQARGAVGALLLLRGPEAWGRFHTSLCPPPAQTPGQNPCAATATFTAEVRPRPPLL